MRRIVFATAAAAVLASSTGCQQCWDSFRRIEAWKFQTVFGRSPDACEQVVAMPTTIAAPICQPIDACSPTSAVSSFPTAAIAAPSPGCACSGGGMTTIPTLPGTLAPSTTYAPGTTITPIPGPTGQ